MSLTEAANIAAAVLLILFALLGVFDGLFLHLWRYSLHAHAESRREHVIHTARALLFPPIVAMIFASSGGYLLWIGVAAAAADMVVLAIDALTEKDSRTFMGGLPRWEYVIHLFANGLHFAAIALALAAKGAACWQAAAMGCDAPGAAVLNTVAVNLLPGAILLGLLHAALLNDRVARVWRNLQVRAGCCVAA